MFELEKDYHVSRHLVLQVLGAIPAFFAFLQCGAYIKESDELIRILATANTASIFYCVLAILIGFVVRPKNTNMLICNKGDSFVKRFYDVYKIVTEWFSIWVVIVGIQFGTNLVGAQIEILYNDVFSQFMITMLSIVGILYLPVMIKYIVDETRLVISKRRKAVEQV